ncbi:hypothetical protein K7432_008381 [Basidiobolus ranarum]|uniref:Galactose oxidase n=1 Tax=Basidiobolus ranarum TaxID=34480 RepID=A0ABR2WRW4_9FUNG
MKLPQEAHFLLFLSVLINSATVHAIIPSWKAFHSSAIANDKLIIFGGINHTVAGKNPITLPGTTDLYVWDIKTGNWSQPTPDGGPKIPQKFTASVSPVTSDKIFTYIPTPDTNEGSIAVLDTNYWSWSYVSSVGAPPASRIAYSFTISNEEAYLFGGIQVLESGELNGGTIFSDLSDFDTSRQVWTSASNGPSVYFHASCFLASQNSILYFGGSIQNGAVNSLHVYNLSTKGWQLNVPFVGENGGPTIPSARIGHTANCLADKMIIFGGTGGTGQEAVISPNDNDVWVLQLVGNTYTWSRAPIKDKSKSPSARMGHTAALSNNQLYVYGGIGAENDNSIYSLNLADWGWTKFSVNSDPNKPTSPNNPFQPNDPSGDSGSGSNSKVVIIVAILSSFFGILAMGVITGIGVRSWKRKKQKNIRVDREAQRKADPDFDSARGDSVSYLPSSSVGFHSNDINPNDSFLIGDISQRPSSFNEHGYSTSYLWNNSSYDASPLGKDSSLLSLYADSTLKEEGSPILPPFGTATSSAGLDGEPQASSSPEIYNSGLQHRGSIQSSSINDTHIHETLSPLDRIARLTSEEQYLNEDNRSGRGLHVVNNLEPAANGDSSLNPQLIQVPPQRHLQSTPTKSQEFKKDYNLDVFATAHDHSPRVKNSLDRLKEVLLSETSIRVPRLFVVLPGDRAGESWKTPSKWGQDTFVLYILCEHTNTHITSHPGFPIANPQAFMKNAGSLVAAISRYCSIQSLPFHTPTIPQEYLNGSSECSKGEYFAEIARILEMFVGEPNSENVSIGWEGDDEDSQIRWLEEAIVKVPRVRSSGLSQLKDYLPEYVESRPLAGLHCSKISPEQLNSPSNTQVTRWLCGYHYKRLGADP